MSLFGAIVVRGIRWVLGKFGLGGQSMIQNPLSTWEALKTGTGIATILALISSATGVLALYLGGQLDAVEALAAASTLLTGALSILRQRVAQGKGVIMTKALLEDHAEAAKTGRTTLSEPALGLVAERTRRATSKTV